MSRHGFWPLALLWLPAGVAAAVRFGPDGGAAGRSAYLGGGTDRGRIAGPGCALRAAAGARLPPALASCAVGARPGRRVLGWAR